MEDARAIDALLDSHAKGASEPLIDEDGNAIDTGYVMGRMREIGEKITQVSFALNLGLTTPKGVLVASHFAYLIGV